MVKLGKHWETIHPEAYTHSSKVGSKKYSADVNVWGSCEGNTFAFYYEV